MHITDIVVSPGLHPGAWRRAAAVHRAEPSAARTRAAWRRRLRTPDAGAEAIVPPRRELPMPFC